MAQTKKSTKKSNVTRVGSSKTKKTCTRKTTTRKPTSKKSTAKKSAGNKPQQKATKFDVYVTSDGSLLIR